MDEDQNISKSTAGKNVESTNESSPSEIKDELQIHTDELPLLNRDPEVIMESKEITNPEHLLFIKYANRVNQLSSTLPAISYLF